MQYTPCPLLAIPPYSAYQICHKLIMQDAKILVLLMLAIEGTVHTVTLFAVIGYYLYKVGLLRMLTN